MHLLMSHLLLIGAANMALAAYKGNAVSGGIDYMYYADGDDNAEWPEANSMCGWKTSTPMEFAMSKSSTINNALKDLTGGQSWTWIGGRDTASEGVFVWVDNTQFSYTNWAPGNPNNQRDQDCVHMNYDSAGKWDDEHCWDRRGYICQQNVNRLSPSDFSELLIYDEWMMARTFWGAKKQCENIGARLVQITDEQSKRAIQKKMGSTGRIKYWVDMEDTSSRCSIMSQKSSEGYDCNVNKGFICEIVWPHSPKVSNENPVVAKSGDLQVSCTASGFPLPDVAWYRDDELVPNQTIGKACSTLEIEDAKPEDAGRYLCVAANSFNGVEKTAMGFTEISVTSNEV